MGVVDKYSKAIYEKQSQLRQYARYSIGRILGTVAATKGSYKFLIDLAESKLFQRAEFNALTALLITKGVFTEEDFQEAMNAELSLALRDLKKTWPEVTPAADGKSFTLDIQGAQKRCSEEEWPR